MASAQSTPPCDLDSEVARVVQEGDWAALEQWMESGQLTDQQKAKVIVEVTRSANGHQFSRHIRPFCSSSQLDSAMEELTSAGLWTDVINLCLFAGQDHLEWRVGDLSISSRLLSVVAEGKWRELRRVFQDDLSSPAQKRWALLQACQRAGQLEIIEDVLPRCAKEDWDGVLQHLVSRGLWWAVGSVFSQRGVISETQRARVMDQAAEVATPWELAEFILPHCTQHQLASVSRQLVTRRLWWALDHLLKKDVHVFSQCVMPACGNTDADLFMSHLLTEGLLKNAQRLIQIVGTRKLQWKLGDASIDSELIHLTAEGKWIDVAFQSEGSVLAWAMEQMSKKAKKNEINRVVTSLCPINQIPSMVKNLVQRKFMEEAASLLCRMVSGIMNEWAKAVSACRLGIIVMGGTVEERMADISNIVKANEEAYWNLLTKSSFDLRDVSELCFKTHDVKCTYASPTAHPDRAWPSSLFDENTSTSENQVLVKILFDSAVSIVLMSLCDRLNALPDPRSVDDEVQLAMTQILKGEIKPFGNLPQGVQPKRNEFKPTARNDSDSHPVFALSFILAVIKHMNIQSQWSFHTGYMLNNLTTVPVVPEIQRNALRFMLSRKAWAILRVSDLSRVGEQVRRFLFWSAVRQKQWSLVRQWADHTLNDDQRRWALEQACKDKQWNVCLCLAEHGLTKEELTHMHCLLAQNADRGVVLHMNEHESGIVEVKEQLTKSKSQIPKIAEIEDRRTLEQAVAEGNWQMVLLAIRQRPAAVSVSLALKGAVASQAWSVVKQLVRLGIPTCDQQPLFVDMVRQQQWGVCTVMVEQGLSAEHYTHFISQLMELDQWTLVGKMMHYETDDAVRRQVMQIALQRKEGSVVSQCITGMKQQLSIQEREDLFHRAAVCGVLQAVVPLVTETDDTGARHRDMALLHAINQHQWDVVDLCLRQHANINVPDDRGNLPVHRAALRDDWETVLALAERGADLSQLGSTGLSVLHMAIRAERWNHIKLLIPLCDDLQRSATHETEKRTLLEMLTDTNMRYFIAEALTQNTQKWKGVNGRGETALHTICLAGLHKFICRLLLQGVNPLSVTHRGHSALSYAVMSEFSTQTTVAECISLGFSTHQRHITHSMQQTRALFLQQTRVLFFSPVLLAVMCGLPTVTQMLYESGSCSFEELFQILHCLLQITDADVQTTSPLMRPFQTEFLIVCSRNQNAPERNQFGVMQDPVLVQTSGKLIRKAALYLIEACSAPRSLKSMCRLVISHCVRISGTRHEDISQLPIPTSLQDYVSFSDLTHPDYGRRKGSGNLCTDAGEPGEEYYAYYGWEEEDYTDEEEEW